MRDRMEEWAREWIKANAPSLCWPDGSIGADDLESLASLLRAVRREALEEAAKAMCGLCADGRKVTVGREQGKEDLIFHPVTLNEAGRYCNAGRVRALISSEEVR